MNPTSQYSFKKPKVASNCTPLEEVHEFDIVTFLKTDRSRDVVRGSIGTVVDLVNYEKYGYTLETNNGNTERFYRHEFRPSSPKDIARHQRSIASRNAQIVQSKKIDCLPKMPTDIQEMRSVDLEKP